MAVEGSTMAHAVLDSAGKVLYANKMARRLGVVSGREADQRIVDAAVHVLKSGDVVDVEMSGSSAPVKVSRRRRPVQVQASLRPIAKVADSSQLVLATAQDETEALRLEQVRRDFVANVSHELKTPVSAISLLSEAMLDAAEDPDSVRRFAGRLLTESSRLNALVGDLIMLSRLQGADPLPTLTLLPVDGVVAEAVEHTRTLAEKFDITIEVLPPSGEYVEGDKSILVTALTNLLDNAIRYSPAGTAVTVGASIVDGVLDISVTDRGIGISPEHQERVFERFFRADPARSRVTGGTGLGLAIVKHAAANHGGRAVLTSEVGVGSTFSLRLPRYKEPAEPVEKKPERKSKARKKG